MAGRKIIVLYDNTCAFCTAQVQIWRRLDWFHAIDFRPGTAPEAAGLGLSATREELQESIHCVTPDGRVYRAARCVRCLSLRIPLLLPLGLLLSLPGVIGLAERVYRRISVNRHALGRWCGCDAASNPGPLRSDPGNPRAR